MGFHLVGKSHGEDDRWEVQGYSAVQSGLVTAAHGGLLNFGAMIFRVLGRFPVTSFAFYGCHCGYGGNGLPVDDIDWCCWVHDCCFGELIAGGCNPYIVHYSFTYRHGILTCSNRNPESCARRACECDRAAVLCFLQHEAAYSPFYSFYPKDRQCNQPMPACLPALSPAP
ncbi:acidic phospholipase A2 Cc1-PLA2-like [Gastrophryne carolinensis]